jgi:hypothetical protein
MMMLLMREKHHLQKYVLLEDHHQDLLPLLHKTHPLVATDLEVPKGDHHRGHMIHHHAAAVAVTRPRKAAAVHHLVVRRMVLTAVLRQKVPQKVVDVHPWDDGEDHQVVVHLNAKAHR